MMKILLLCNSLIPEATKLLDEPCGSKPESWISAVYSAFYGIEEYEFVYLYPSKKDGSVEKTSSNFTFVNYKQNLKTVSSAQIKHFEELIKKYRPNIIHCFGTELPHTYAMSIACENLNIKDSLIISIQGLVSYYAFHYDAFLPYSVTHWKTFRDILKHGGIYAEKKSFEKRGKTEQAAIKRCNHIIGRTDWDKACVKQINPNAEYHFCNEILRDTFYEKQWDPDKCKKRSIFISQSSYPIKGFHIMLEAMSIIRKFYPDTVLFTTGPSPFQMTFIQKLKKKSYSKYLCQLITKHNLKNNVCFLGYLDEKEMCEAYLKANIFVCCSSIENSPNSLGEAMILGMPCITSDVGGVKNHLTHDIEGYVYQADAPYMLAYYVMEMFDNNDRAVEMGNRARLHALKTYDKEANVSCMKEIYEKIDQNNNLK